eukprot:Blabericola_migrator_1__8289@NODE_42_length_17171_cov_64_374065_g38_i0_p3_GENE_NODE_42_length_17171_cov_64_374065_g38_i0NODE_42_length_17171_cov_64_374065_g38_i0_p3_ORF_typecomplete_len231_score28_13_NODE_42_length_17171_cov_64_374065_g38_i04291121
MEPGEESSHGSDRSEKSEESLGGEVTPAALRAEEHDDVDEEEKTAAAPKVMATLKRPVMVKKPVQAPVQVPVRFSPPQPPPAARIISPPPPEKPRAETPPALSGEGRPINVSAPEGQNVDYLASIVAGHWVTITPIEHRTAADAKQEVSKARCERAHYGDPNKGPWVCEDCEQRRARRHGVTCSGRAASILNKCTRLCCSCGPRTEPMPPYPADFSRPYQPVAYYFRSVE